MPYMEEMRVIIKQSTATGRHSSTVGEDGEDADGTLQPSDEDMEVLVVDSDDVDSDGSSAHSAVSSLLRGTFQSWFADYDLCTLAILSRRLWRPAALSGLKGTPRCRALAMTDPPRVVVASRPVSVRRRVLTVRPPRRRRRPGLSPVVL